MPKPDQYFCTKWLRYYWDFCYKYHHDQFLISSLPLFLRKLQEKKQSSRQQNQAQFAIYLLYDMNAPSPHKQNAAPFKKNSYQIQEKHKNSNAPAGKVSDESIHKNVTHASTFTTSGQQSFPETSGKSWVIVNNQLENEIKLRHYSPKTLKAYRSWTRQFQGYTKSKDYQFLCQQDVIDFLTWLTVERKLSASSQNQAFNALLFYLNRC